ncbi:MAG: hypothetical protein WDN72_04720 [Alphaproteobacteria bacterium]
MDETQNALKIAVIEEQIGGLREQQRAHNAVAQTRFDRMERKLDDLTATINRGKGAYAASLLIAGIVGGFFLKLAGLLTGYFER